MTDGCITCLAAAVTGLLAIEACLGALLLQVSGASDMAGCSWLNVSSWIIRYHGRSAADFLEGGRCSGYLTIMDGTVYILSTLARDIVGT